MNTLYGCSVYLLPQLVHAQCMLNVPLVQAWMLYHPLRNRLRQNVALSTTHSRILHHKLFTGWSRNGSLLCVINGDILRVIPSSLDKVKQSVLQLQLAQVHAQDCTVLFWHRTSDTRAHSLPSCMLLTAYSTYHLLLRRTDCTWGSSCLIDCIWGSINNYFIPLFQHSLEIWK